ncbi:MAG: hypothetical protein FJX34_00135 [Alphaproteobacteria bacterium]|nr:hypothetical protein [Alphaproteobacteria bacterium]
MQTLLIIGLVTTLLLTSCVSYKPIFDKNEKYLADGDEAAQREFKDCKAEADEYLDKLKAERAAREAGRSAVIGGVVGGVVGALSSNKHLKSGLTGGLIGAGVGAAVGALKVVGEDKIVPDATKQNYVANCLAKKGYSIMGWY